MVAYRLGPIAYVREWRQREIIQIPYTFRDSDLEGPFALRPRLHIHSAVYGLRCCRRKSTRSIAWMCARCA